MSVSNQTARRIATFLYLLFCLTGNSVFSAEEELSRVRISTEYTSQGNLYVLEPENLERRFGPYDQSLLEPLDALISLHPSVDGYAYTEVGDGGAKIHAGNYTAWNESVPFTPMPIAPDMLSDIELGKTRVDIRLRISSRGKTRGTDAETSDPVRARRDAEDALKEMVFRPRFVGTRWRPIRNLTMTNWYPTEKLGVN